MRQTEMDLSVEEQEQDMKYVVGCDISGSGSGQFGSMVE